MVVELIHSSETDIQFKQQENEVNSKCGHSPTKQKLVSSAQVEAGQSGFVSADPRTLKQVNELQYKELREIHNLELFDLIDFWKPM